MSLPIVAKASVSAEPQEFTLMGAPSAKATTALNWPPPSGLTSCWEPKLNVPLNEPPNTTLPSWSRVIAFRLAPSPAKFFVQVGTPVLEKRPMKTCPAELCIGPVPKSTVPDISPPA